MTIPSEVDPLPDTARKALAAQAVPDVSFLAVGRMVSEALGAAEILSADGLVADVYDMRWVKPIDCAAVREACRAGLVVTLEEGPVSGGFGSGVLEVMADEGLAAPVLRLGLPDAYVGHGTVSELFAELGLDPASIAVSVKERLDSLNRLRS